jgi:hypothetical protein
MMSVSIRDHVVGFASSTLIKFRGEDRSLSPTQTWPEIRRDPLLIILEIRRDLNGLGFGQGPVSQLKSQKSRGISPWHSG